MPLPLRPDSAVAYILYIGLSVVLRGRHSERLFPFIQSPRLAMPCSISDHSVEAIAYTLYIGLSERWRDRYSEPLFPFIQSPRLAVPCSISDHSVKAIAYTLYIGQSGARRDRYLKGLASGAVFLRYSKQGGVLNHRASPLHTIHGY